MFHRAMMCWMDDWYDLTMEDIRALEDATKEALANVRATTFLTFFTLFTITISNTVVGYKIATCVTYARYSCYCICSNAYLYGYMVYGHYMHSGDIFYLYKSTKMLLVERLEIHK